MASSRERPESESCTPLTIPAADAPLGWRVLCTLGYAVASPQPRHLGY
jgi:hypothetical protein